MTTAASLRDRTAKELGQLAKKKGISGWHSMRKDQLVKAIVKASGGASATKPERNGSARKTSAAKTKRKSPAGPRTAAAKKSTPRKKTTGKKSAAKRSTAKRPAKAARGAPKKKSSKSAKQSNKPKKGSAKSPRSRSGKKSSSKPSQKKAPRASRKTGVARSKGRAAPAPRRHAGPKDLTTSNGKGSTNGAFRDRLVLMVRDSFWLHAVWEISRQSVERAQAAMAENWHAARPVLRLLEVDEGSTTSTAERVERDIEIHGGVKNWYIDVPNPPKSFRVAIGYLADGSGTGQTFYAIARSNAVTTPRPGSSDSIDRNWIDVAENYEQIYAQSATRGGTGGELKELFEERLRRPMGKPVVARYGVGAEGALGRRNGFEFEVDAEMIIYGATHSDAHVTLGGKPVKLRDDGTFTVRLSMPDRRQVLPVVANSADGVEQRTVVLAVERNTKVMEPMVRDPNEPL